MGDGANTDPPDRADNLRGRYPVEADQIKRGPNLQNNGGTMQVDTSPSSWTPENFHGYEFVEPGESLQAAIDAVSDASPRDNGLVALKPGATYRLDADTFPITTTTGTTLFGPGCFFSSTETARFST